MSDQSYICTFNDDRGFGFIWEPSRKQEVFFHISDYRGENPGLGEFVDYEIAPGQNGRDKAICVHLIEDKPELRKAWALTRPMRKTSACEELRAALRGAIWELEKVSSWYGDKHPDVEAARRQFLGVSLATDELADLCISNGLRQKTAFEDYERLIKKHGPQAETVADARKTLEAEYPRLKGKIEKVTDAASRFYRRRSELQRSSLRQSNIDHRIQAQSATGSWLLFIDETGASFARDKYSPEGREQGSLGRFVAVLVPDPISLQALDLRTHFVDLGVTERDRVVQHLLDSSVGIFGIGVDDLPETRGNRWVDGVVLTIGWVLRLLPVDGPTEVHILVEQRGVHSTGQGDWNATSRVLLSNLAATHPDRYGKIKTSIQVVTKDASPYLAYADAIAHTWGAKSLDAKTRLKQSGLRGTCLHHGDGDELMRAWDILKRGSTLDGYEWQQLIHNPDSGSSAGVARVLLDQVAQSCREAPDLWKRYFDATYGHLESKAVELAGLGKEVAWLAACKPENSEIPPNLELAWRIAELEEKNHRGCIDAQTVARLEELGDGLYSEYPQLVCQADLTRAVLATNCFQFEEAGKALNRWKGKEMVIAGRRHWGRVQSSLGQHAAFGEDFEQAEECFARAIEAFRGMADRGESSGEVAQTATYRAIAALDNPDCGIETVRKHVSGVVSLNSEAIQGMARSTSAADKYKHHLLLRYLVGHGNPDESDAYLAEREHWSEGYGHPWPLIQAYRGMLLRPRDSYAATDLLVDGYEIAVTSDQGPTMHLIGFTIATIAIGWGSDSLFDGAELLELVKILPGAEERINCLNAALEKPLDQPEQLLSSILPFNFR